MTERRGAPPPLPLKIERLPALPTVVASLLASIDNDSVDASALARGLEREPALASRTLRLANSPFFGLSGRISSIPHAITVLGLKAIRSMVLACSVGDAFQRAGVSPVILQGFWRHAFEVAAGARELARNAALAPDTAFLAGLLHDIGVLVCLVETPVQAEAITHYIENAALDLVTAEQQLDVPGHALLGRSLAQAWHFPPALCEAIGGHHRVPLSSDPLTRVVHVADTLSLALQAGQGQQTRISQLDSAAWCALDLQPSLLARVLRVMRAAGATAKLVEGA